MAGRIGEHHGVPLRLVVGGEVREPEGGTVCEGGELGTEAQGRRGVDGGQQHHREQRVEECPPTEAQALAPTCSVIAASVSAVWASASDTSATENFAFS